MKIPWLLIGILLMSACGPANDSGLREELGNQSATTGLALVEALGNRIMVIPFDGGKRYFRAEYPEPLVVVFGKSGRMLLWYNPSLLGSKSDFLVDNLIGGELTKKRAPVLGFSPGALHEDSGHLAFWCTAWGKDRRKGLYWASLDFSVGGFVDSADGEYPWSDWSPDGARLTYEKGGRVYLFDISSGSAKSLVAGHVPTWSPNGKWIAFRAPGGKASLVTIEGTPVNWPISSHEVLGAMRWSPDGRYVIFAEPLTGRIPFIGAAYRLAVSRVSDGKTVTAQEFGPGAVDTGNFYWILGYRKFCSTCKSGEPFQ